MIIGLLTGRPRSLLIPSRARLAVKATVRISQFLCRSPDSPGVGYQANQ
jgi:hypothetical protein